jgi:hypothetical protein
VVEGAPLKTDVGWTERLRHDKTAALQTTTSTRCAFMLAAPSRDWNVFKQIFAEHWDGFTHAHPRYQTSYYDGLVAKMLACGNPEQMGYLERSYWDPGSFETSSSMSEPSNALPRLRTL